MIHPPKIDFEFNPLLMALYLNWWKAPTTSVQPPPVAQAFFICPGDVPKPEDDDVPPPVPSLASAAKHVSLYSFATSPPVSQIRIVFDVSGTEAGSNEEWVRETPAHIERLDGVRVIDIIRGMYSWSVFRHPLRIVLSAKHPEQAPDSTHIATKASGNRAKSHSKSGHFLSTGSQHGRRHASPMAI